jgi:4'-phosphopantetheinyl transferase
MGVMLELCAQDFSASPPAISLSDEEVHLWLFPHWSSTPQAAQSQPVRELLATYLGMTAAQVRIVRDAHGKPRLAQGQLEFNLAHTGAFALVGIMRKMPLGVDIEHLQRPRDVLKLARRFFAPAEAQTLETLPQAKRLEAFLALWSCKEAILKAIGRGLAFGLDRVTFDVDAHGHVAGLVHIEGGEPHGWQVLRLRPATDLVGAVAWYGAPRRVRAYLAPSIA